MRPVHRLLAVVAFMAFASAKAARAAPLMDHEPRGGLWFSLAAYLDLTGVVTDFGMLAAIGVPLDRLEAKRASRAVTLVAEPPVILPRRAPTKAAPPIIITSAIARATVGAAWRASGMGDDGRFVNLASRARSSALLPEIRLRMLHTTQDSVAGGDVTTSPSLYSGNRTFLEARATFKLDRLVFADEEIAVERLRADRLVERLRLANHALEALSKWQRARVDFLAAPVESVERIEAELRMLEAAGALEVMTAGWFAAWLAGQSLAEPVNAAP